MIRFLSLIFFVFIIFPIFSQELEGFKRLELLYDENHIGLKLSENHIKNNIQRLKEEENIEDIDIEIVKLALVELHDKSNQIIYFINYIINDNWEDLVITSNLKGVKFFSRHLKREKTNYQYDVFIKNDIPFIIFRIPDNRISSITICNLLTGGYTFFEEIKNCYYRFEEEKIVISSNHIDYHLVYKEDYGHDFILQEK